MKAIAKRTAMFAVACLMITGTAAASLPEKEVQAASGYTGYIKSATTSLKRSKSKKSKTLARIKKGKKVTVYYTSGSWRKISYKVRERKDLSRKNV